MQVEGFFITDRVKLQYTIPDPTALDSFRFFAITNATNLPAVAGVFGTGLLTSSSVDSYVDQLAIYGNIPKRIVSYFLGSDPNSQQSSVTFGDSNPLGFSGSTYSY